MNEPNLQSQVEAARAYESLFVPALFGQWAPRVADLAHLQPGHRVLDVACGTGTLAREVAARVRPGGHVAGIDPGAGMIAVARELAPDVDWHTGVAEKIPFPDDSFDAVVSQFGLMFFSDPDQALREMVRVLKPGGPLVIAVWASLASTPAYAAEAELFHRLAGPEAGNAVRAPYTLGDEDTLANLLQRNGVASPHVRTVRGQARFPSIRVMVEADLRGWLPVMGVHLSEAQIESILLEAQGVLAPFDTADGVAFDAPALIVTARK